MKSMNLNNFEERCTFDDQGDPIMKFLALQVFTATFLFGSAVHAATLSCTFEGATASFVTITENKPSDGLATFKYANESDQVLQFTSSSFYSRANAMNVYKKYFHPYFEINISGTGPFTNDPSQPSLPPTKFYGTLQGEQQVTKNLKCEVVEPANVLAHGPFPPQEPDANYCPSNSTSQCQGKVIGDACAIHHRDTAETGICRLTPLTAGSLCMCYNN
jgi:hypothetical protein